MNNDPLLSFRPQESASGLNPSDSLDSEDSALRTNAHRNGPPIQGIKKPKVPYEVIRREWRAMLERGERPNKSALGRRLGVSVSVIRGVLNSHDIFTKRERRHKMGLKRSGLILGFD